MVLLFYTICLVFIFIGRVFYNTSLWKRSHQIGLFLIRLGIAFLILETVSLGIFYFNNGNLIYFEAVNDNYKLFQPDDALIGINKPNVSLTHKGVKISHNSEGWRGKIMSNDAQRRVLCIGGSTTYGVGVNDDETWPYYLDSLLGDKFEVLNYGIPGHSSREHVLLIKRYLVTYRNKVADFDFDLVLIHSGLNDLRSSHVRDVGDVYNEFHAPTVFGSLGFCPLEQLPKLASLRLFISGLQKAGFYKECIYHAAEFSGKEENYVDETLRNRYEEYLLLISNLFEYNNIDCIFLPQVANSNNFKDGAYKWWVPYLSDSAIKPSIDSFNQSMISASKNTNAIVIDSLMRMKWETDEFSDPSHLNSHGNLRFAKVVASKIIKNYD